MKIYVSHSRAFDFQNELYNPLQNSEKLSGHTLILPHEKSERSFQIKKKLLSIDLILAEVSFPSTGQGIELDWADINNVPILLMSRRNSVLSNSLEMISENHVKYSTSKELLENLSKYLIPIKSN